ncbi:hypothetical protein [Sphingobacterium sp.]|uniref:hypothetical protein n=1 Tax=Sphingobacterium sp. TaxID=341027 RepID=UPI002899F818|nr:hypothetical protein [Sphingobacterium sp.]
MKYYLIAALFLLSCSGNHSSFDYDTLITQVTDGDTVCLYLKNNRMIAGTTRNDSSVYTYPDKSSIAHKMVIYSKQSKSIINQCTNKRDEQEGYDVMICSNGERFLQESEQTEKAPFYNKYLLLSDDLYYLRAIVSDTAFSGFGKSADYRYAADMNLGVGQVQGSHFSPFLEGSIIRKIEIEGKNGFLNHINARFYDEINDSFVDYNRVYYYNDDSTLNKIVTQKSNSSIPESTTYFYYSYR